MMDLTNDGRLYGAALTALYIGAGVNILSLPFITAPYGKHVRPGWGPAIPASLAWVMMESPTLWLSLSLYPQGRHASSPLPILLFSLYLLHYLHRTLLYPLRLSAAPNQKPFPVSVALMAFAFNLLNAYLQARSLSHYHAIDTSSYARVLLGSGLFLWGMRLNIASDLKLLEIKKERNGYRVPRGGWFEYVCSPNYMGEAAEWLGWALASGASPAAWGFFLYTCSNLVPRAKANLRWYRDKFGEEYPKSMKAILPFVF